VAVPPAQIVALFTVGAKEALTVTVVVTGELVHVPVPTTVYVVVTDGLAVTTDPVVALRPVEGDQV
jgi:hypothetical protein